MDIQCKQLLPHHTGLLCELACLYAAVFETKDFQMPSLSWLEKVLQDEKIVFIAALAENELAGGLTAYIVPSLYTESCGIYLYDLAVNPVWQRKGIGKKLLQELRSYGRSKGYFEIFLQAEAGDLHAIDFYRSTGGREEPAVQFSYKL